MKTDGLSETMKAYIVMSTSDQNSYLFSSYTFSFMNVIINQVWRSFSD